MAPDSAKATNATKPDEPPIATSNLDGSPKLGSEIYPVEGGTAIEKSTAANERGKDALRAKRYSDAILEFERAYQLDPGEPVYPMNLAMAYFVTGRMGNAVILAHRLLKNSTGLTILQHRFLAVLAGRSIRHCVAAGSFCGKEPWLTDEQLAQLDLEGQNLLKAGRQEQAFLAFLRAFAFSGKPGPLLRIATLEYVRGEYKNALDDALVAKEFMGNDAPALLKEAQTLIAAIEKECAAQNLACK